jgi:hypothetical protein
MRNFRSHRGGEERAGKPSKRTIRHSSNAELSACLEESNVRSFDIDGERRVFDLYGVDVVDFAGAAEGLRGDFGEAQVFDLSLSGAQYKISTRSVQRRGHGKE